MPLNYTHTTFAQAQAQLAQLLNDTGNTFYSAPELGVYIVEALRWWGSATGYWRDRGTFTTSTTVINGDVTHDNPWYDLPTFLPALRGYNVIDSDLLTAVEYHLLEPAAVPYTGSTQFTQSEIVSALQRRRDQFLLESGTVIVHSPQIIPDPPPVGRVVLGDITMAVRRAAWQNNATLQWNILPRSDEWFMLSYYAQPFNQQFAISPQVFSVALTPPLTMQLEPPPQGKGWLDLLVIHSGATLNPVDPHTGVLMGIPDDFTWAVKFGALADLLGGDGPAADPARAAYCEKRWQEGLMLAKMAQSVMFLWVNDTPAYSESLDSVDSNRILWQNYSGIPFMGAMAGLNLLAMVDPPGGQFGVTIDCVQNAIVPVNPGDYIQVGREELAAILGYAQHLAQFKCGGAEFQNSFKWHERIMSLAGTYNSKLKAQTQPALTDRASTEKRRRPVILQGVS